MDYPEIIEEEFDSSSAGRGIQDTSNSSQSAPIAYPDMPHLGFEIGDGAEAASNRQSHLSSNWARSRPFGTKMASTTGMQPIQAYGSTHSFQPPGSTSSTHDQAPNGDGQSHTHQPAHKRNYQACEACRKRKVKCVLGPDPDNPTDPPCDRCKREHKECLFAETRKKTKLSDDADGNQNGRLRVDSSESQTFPTTFSNPSSAQRQRRLTSPTSIKPEILPSDSSAHASEHSISRHYTSYPSQFNQQPPYTPSQSTHTMAAAGYKRSATANGGSDEFQVRSAVAVDLLGAAAPTTHDNLSILSSAAAQLEEGNRQAQSAGVRSPSDAFDTPSTAGGALSQTFSNTMQPISIDVVLNGNTAGAGNPQQNSDIANAIKAWSSMRFVRAGWFRAEEAMNYVEYYYKNLSPMTPVATADFRHPSKHLTLLTEEPLLAIAILTIASRYMKLSGSGSGTRAYQIHDKLWNYLRCMVERLLWGQEQFGGGFCGGGSTKIRPLKGGAFTWKGSLRTLGTIEALLLLTDWQPRALHFPPGDDENRLLDTDYDLSSGNTSPAGDDDQNETLGSNTRNLPYANWLEPSWRSDRMSWMLLGLAQALSFELGVFDRNHYDCQSSEHDLHSECARKRRVRRMVLVYVSQVSGRLGIPSMLPLQHWGTDPVFERDSKQQSYGQPEDPVDTMQSCWLEIATIMYKANQKIFPTKHYTHELLINGRYHERIEEFGPLLKAWKVNFEKVKPGLRPQMQNILIAEYEYARFYINSLGLQKVITDIKEYERNAREGAMSHESNGSYQKEPIPASVLDSFAIPNRAYTDEVADAARVVLRAVIDGLAPQGHLRNAPVRTYLRALAAIMFLLKTFCLGAGEGDVRYSLSLIYRSTELMGTDVVDDVHLCNQSAALIKVLTDHLRPSILRVKGSGPRNGSEAVSGEQSHNQTTHQNSLEDHSHAAKRQRTSSTNRRLPARSDPLEGIPAQPMADLSNYTFMPPPNYNQQQMTGNMDANLNMSLDPNGDPSMSGTDPNTWNADWLAFPLDNLFNSSTGTVDQGFGNIGPTVGDRDMLELITNEHYDQWDVGVMNFGNGFH